MLLEMKKTRSIGVENLKKIHDRLRQLEGEGIKLEDPVELLQKYELPSHITSYNPSGDIVLDLGTNGDGEGDEDEVNMDEDEGQEKKKKRKEKERLWKKLQRKLLNKKRKSLKRKKGKKQKNKKKKIRLRILYTF